MFERQSLALLLTVPAAALWGPPLAAQQTQKLKLNAALVLTPEFCNSELKRGNGWTSVKEDFRVGERLCPGLAEALSSVFASLRKDDSPPVPNAGTDDVILIPKVGDIGATQKSLAFSKREMVVV